jgi:hypothetical protein
MLDKNWQGKIKHYLIISKILAVCVNFYQKKIMIRVILYHWINFIEASYNRAAFYRIHRIARQRYGPSQVIPYISLTTRGIIMKIQSLFVVSIICFLSGTLYAKDEAKTDSDAVTGICKDGTPYTGTSKRGACRGHQGIKEWYADKSNADKPAAEEKVSKSKKESKAEKSSKTEAAATESTGVATGLCKDGTEYTGASKRGACRGHKGIKEWYADKKEAAPAVAEKSESEKTAPKESQASTTSAAATGLCKDGTEYTGASKRGACRGHKGLKEWYADKQAEEPVAAPAKEKAAPVEAEESDDEALPEKPNKQIATGGGAGKVWVNTRSKIYHCEGSHFYGNTKEGEYMSEADAQAKGFTANRKKVCN